MEKLGELGELKELLNRDELRRLQRAAKDKDIRKLADWGKQFENQIVKEYEDIYKERLLEAIDNFILTIVYTLHFNEKTKFRRQKNR